MNALLILKQTHEDLKGQFEELLHTYNPLQAQELWRKLQPVLKRHEQIEETYVYAPLRQDSGADPALAEWVKQPTTTWSMCSGSSKKQTRSSPLMDAFITNCREFGTHWVNTFGEKRSRSSPELSKFGAILASRRPDGT